MVPAVLDAGAAASISASIADGDAVSGDAPRPNRPATAETAARGLVRLRARDAREVGKRIQVSCAPRPVFPPGRPDAVPRARRDAARGAAGTACDRDAIDAISRVSHRRGVRRGRTKGLLGGLHDRFSQNLQKFGVATPQRTFGGRFWFSSGRFFF